MIRPALQAGKIVITDRFSDSSFAYQAHAGRHRLARLESWVVGDTRPALTFLLDIAPRVGLARVAARGAQTSFDARDEAFHAGVRRRFLAIARAAPERVKQIDAARPADAIAEEIFALVAERRAELSLIRRRRTEKQAT